MAGNSEGLSQDSLSKQDLSKLDVTKLTALSPEVISRQATINIGTIGHVAHGKSTVVKAVSGVQTVRFKNELERNITIKLEPLQVMNQDASKYQTVEATKDDKKPMVRKRKRRRDDSTSKQRHVSVDEEPSVYEVEKIVGHKTLCYQHLYEVKWKNWKSKYNTWEPLKNLDGCIDLLFEFYESIADAEFNEAEFRRLKFRLKLECGKQDVLSLLPNFRSPDGELSVPDIDSKEIERKLKIYCRLDPDQNRRDPGILEALRKDMMIHRLHKERQQQDVALKEWEDEINSLSTSKAPILVVNNVDLEGPPANFFYINDYLPGEDIKIPDDPPLGCSCLPHCSSHKKLCCARTADGYFAYNQEGLLKLPVGTPVFECNKKCSCDESCANRVVQKGRKVKLCIFRTNNGCGWGVKTMEDIKKGTFVTEYVGEVISNEEADRRGKLYDKEGQTYLFDLDFNDKNVVLYTVDAAVYGNVSHFINHSCSPNMSVYAVWINCLDPYLPKLALFATRDIKAGEELSFDYLCQSVSNKNGITCDIKSESDQNETKMLCKCGSKKCRKFLF